MVFTEISTDKNLAKLTVNDGHNHYVAVETSISVVLNIVISALFMFLVFGRTVGIELWGTHGLALDFVPQTFMITLMSVWVPSLITRRRIRCGRIKRLEQLAPSRLPRSIFLRAVAIGCVLTVLAGGCAVLIASALWHVTESFWHVLPFKLAYGALVAAIATPLGLRAILSEG
jgi:hypothetical protein